MLWNAKFLVCDCLHIFAFPLVLHFVKHCHVSLHIRGETIVSYMRNRNRF